jgi:hypothetical protein
MYSSIVGPRFLYEYPRSRARFPDGGFFFAKRRTPGKEQGLEGGDPGVRKAHRQNFAD